MHFICFLFFDAEYGNAVSTGRLKGTHQIITELDHRTFDGMTVTVADDDAVFIAFVRNRLSAAFCIRFSAV